MSWDLEEPEDMSAAAWADALTAAVTALDKARRKESAPPAADLRRLCAHADQNGCGAHWLEPGGNCSRAEPGREAYQARVLFLPGWTGS